MKYTETTKKNTEEKDTLSKKISEAKKPAEIQ